MKKRWIGWWVVNAVWLLIFALATVFIWTREVDGTGAVQTPEARFLAFAVLLVAFILPLIIQIAWLIVNLRASSRG